MRNKKILIRILCLFLVFMVVGASGALLICQRCGHENTQGVAACTHCATPFPVRDTPSQASSDVEEDEAAGNGYLPQEIPEREIAEGQKYLLERQYDVARFFFLNALALEAATDPAIDHRQRTDAVLGMIRSAEQASSIIRKACPFCAGSGQRQIAFEGLRSGGTGATIRSDRAISVEGGSSVRCTHCDGTGVVFAEGTIEERKFARNAAASAYGVYQRARRYEPLGGAWVPPNVIDTLSVRQKARVMRSIVLPCRSCGGFGRSDCRHCNGLGHRPCSRCNGGRVPVVLARERVQRLGADRTQECDTCEGVGTLACGSCQAEGTIACKACEGSGEADLCRACTARGYVTCNRCRGSKVFRGEACAHCRAEGYLVCSSCKGRGRRE